MDNKFIQAIAEVIGEMNSNELVGTTHVPTEYKECVGCNILGVKSGTTGYKGGDSGHGGRTVFKIEDLSSTDLMVSINGSGYFSAKEVGIAFGGDSELETFIQALEFTLGTYKSQMKK